MSDQSRYDAPRPRASLPVQLDQRMPISPLPQSPLSRGTSEQVFGRVRNVSGSSSSKLVPKHGTFGVGARRRDAGGQPIAVARAMTSSAVTPTRRRRPTSSGTMAASV